MEKTIRQKIGKHVQILNGMKTLALNNLSKSLEEEIKQIAGMEKEFVPWLTSFFQGQKIHKLQKFQAIFKKKFISK